MMGGWNHGLGVQSDSLYLVCFGRPSDSRRLVLDDDPVDRTAADALDRGLHTFVTSSSGASE